MGCEGELIELVEGGGLVLKIIIKKIPTTGKSNEVLDFFLIF